MTKKDFERFATEFGMTLRDYDGTGLEHVAWATIGAFCEAARQANPRFDRERFEAWVREVASHVRDASGRKFS